MGWRVAWRFGPRCYRILADARANCNRGGPGGQAAWRPACSRGYVMARPPVPPPAPRLDRPGRRPTFRAAGYSQGSGAPPAVPAIREPESGGPAGRGPGAAGRLVDV